MGKNRWTYKRPPAWRRNEPTFTQTACTRILQLNRWSNVAVDELFRLGGVDLRNPELPFIDRLGYDTIVKTKNQEIEHLESFGIQLFANKLPVWRPADL